MILVCPCAVSTEIFVIASTVYSRPVMLGSGSREARLARPRKATSRQNTPKFFSMIHGLIRKAADE